MEIFKMKTLNITFTDAEYKRLFNVKKNFDKFNSISWHRFILVKCCKKEKKQ